MKKVLIIGSDLHAIRYINSLLFVDDLKLFILNDHNKTKEIIEQYNIGELNMESITSGKINSFDYIIYTTPNSFDNKIYNIIKSYKGNLLLEKPQMKISIIKKMNCNIYFIHLRKFNDTIYNEPSNINYIEWPNLVYDGMDAIINTLPNIIDYISCLYKNEDLDEFCIDKIKRDSNYIEFKVNICDEFMVKIYNTDKKGNYPIMNGLEIKWPNFFICINNLAKEILQDNLSCLNTIKQEQKYINIIKKIRGDI